MRIARDLSGADLIRCLGLLGDEATCQTSSPIRLTSRSRDEHYVTIPKHDPLRIGMFASIPDAVAAQHGLTQDELLKRLFD